MGKTFPMAGDPYVPSEDTRLWRYMKLNSFLELLSGHLIQTRIDVLNDAAEGAYGYKRIHFRDERDTRAAIRRARTRVAATYWFEFEQRESYGMWSIYGRSGESVAIETTVGALREVLKREGKVRIERMRYEPMRGQIDDIATLFFISAANTRRNAKFAASRFSSSPSKSRSSINAFPSTISTRW